MSRPGELDALATESVDERFAAIDQMTSLELAAVINDADATVPAAVRRALPEIAAAADAIVGRLAAGGRLIYTGAGTSGRLGVLDAAECPPTFGTEPAQVVGLIAGGRAAQTAAREGVEDDEAAGAEDIAVIGVSPADAVVGIAASGRTPYVLAAVASANELGAVTIGLSCNTATPLSAAVDVAIEVPVGPEVVAGSTRMKAGTAQKLVLNMLSTITMVRLGKTYRNLMIDVRPTNEKLRRRAARIVAAIADVDEPTARHALEETAFDVRTAVLVAALDISRDAASARLRAAAGHVREALELP